MQTPNPLAHALAQEPAPQPEAPRKRRFPVLFRRHPEHYGLIMEKTSSLDVHKDPGPHIRVQSGTYTPQLGLRFWLPERIGPGYVSLFSSGNPEPISTVPPRGYGAADWAHLLGGPLKNLAMGGFEAPDQPKSLKPWLKWVLLAAAAAIFLVMMAIEVFHVGKGG